MKKYREVFCPICKKKYMTYVYDDDYDVVISQGSKSLYGWHVLEGRTMDDFDEKDIQEKWILR